MTEIPISLSDIRDAAKRLEGIARRTPLLYSDSLSVATGCKVYLKAENLQRTGSYKVRGAYNMIAQMKSEKRSRGVIAASAGNHAQGVALAAAEFGIQKQTTIVMPRNRPKIKYNNTKHFGVEILDTDPDFDAAKRHAKELADASDRELIPPFDNWQVIAGQGTIALEIFEDLGFAPDTIIAGVGGGGLISGIAIAARESMPQTEIFGVQSSTAASMRAALRNGSPIEIPIATIADGMRVKEAGVRTHGVVEKLLGEEHLIDIYDPNIAKTIKHLAEKDHLVAEGAGATPVTALIEQSELPPEKRALALTPGSVVVAVITGGNIDPKLLRGYLAWASREEVQLLELRVPISDTPGKLSELLKHFAELNIAELDVCRWHPGDPTDPDKSAVIDLVVEVDEKKDERQTILQKLRDAKIPHQVGNWS